MSLEQHPLEKIGKYKILGVLGKGGMGIVYKGLDPDIEREVAIKTIRIDTFIEGPEKEEMLNRVTREAKAAGRLSHPNIITIYDVFRENDLTFIVMQFVDGQSLQSLIETGKSFSPRDVIDILKPVSESLDFAHQNGIVHRDIKPANILIDKTGKPFLADFGVARIETSTMTGAGTTIGTLSYMSPEQIMGKKVDGRADFFALGVILYELLTGRKPFAGENLSTIVYKIVHEEPQRVTEINQDLPRGYEGVISKALAKNPDDRYQTGRELIDDLEEPDKLAAATQAYKIKTGVSRETRAKKGRPLALAGGMILFAAVAWGIYAFLSRGGDETQVITPSQTTPNKPDSSPPSPAENLPPAPPTAPAAESLARLKDSFELRNFSETIQLAEKILNEYPDNALAREYQRKARAGLAEVQLASILRTGVANFDSGNYAACVQDMEKALGLDKDNKEAQDYLLRADTALSRRDILALIQGRRLAEENEDLDAVLGYLDSEALAAQQWSIYTQLFMIYDGIKSTISSNSVQINTPDRTHASISFHHTIQGISNKDGKQKTIFFGTKYWKLQKRGKAWKIVEITEGS